MAEIIRERVTAHTEEPFAVFLIGMRVNKPWKVHRWLPVARAMGRMLGRTGARRKEGRAWAARRRGDESRINID